MIGTEEYIKNREKMCKRINNLEQITRKKRQNQEKDKNTENTEKNKTQEKYTNKYEIVEKNDEYHYIKTDALNQVFRFCSNNTNVFTCHLCIFSIRNHKYSPFVTFLMEKQTASYSFPTFPFQCPEMEDVDIYFKNECVKKAFSLLQIYEQINENTVNDVYKGFVSDAGNANIFVIFDISKYNFDVKKEGKYIFAILDELTNRKKIKNIPVSPIVDVLFTENRQTRDGVETEKKRFHTLYDGNNVEISNPSIAYNCRWDEENNTYVNIFKMDLEIENNGLCSKNICAIQHAEYGTNYFFSSTPIIQANIQNIVRYAVYKPAQEKDETKERDQNDEIWFVEEAYRIAIV